MAIAGGSFNHTLLSAKIGSQLDQALKNRKYAVFSADLMIGYNKENYVYSDTSVICGKPAIYEEDKKVVKNPCLVVEILWNETAEYD